MSEDKQDDLRVYFLVRVDVKNEEIFEEYRNCAREDDASWDLKPLAIDYAPEIIEGEWSRTHTVLLQFRNEAAFKRWYYSSSYERAINYRQAASECDAVLLRGHTAL